MWPMWSQTIKIKVQVKIPNWLRFSLNVKSVIINHLKQICTHQRFISVINRLKKAHLKTHSQVQHGRIKFKCNHCDHKANQRCDLKSHKGSLPTCAKSSSCSTQDPQVLLHYWLTSICPPQPQHKIHPCCNSIILHFPEWCWKESKVFLNVHIITDIWYP